MTALSMHGGYHCMAFLIFTQKNIACT